MESTIYGKKTSIQLNVLRLTITAFKELPGGKMEALEIFNRHAADFGLKPIAIPK